MIKENLLNKKEIELINKATSYFEKYLQSEEFVFIHNDIHFDNIIYKDDKIKVIDFERSMIAPLDKELDIFFIMIDMSWKYANEISAHYVVKEDYQNIKQYVAKYYPEILRIPYLDVRLAIYNLSEYLRAYYFYQSEMDLKKKIIDKAQYIIAFEKN